MRNSISHRIADFLKKYPPFSSLPSKDLESLAIEVTIIHKPEDSVVFGLDESPHSHFYIVHQGAVGLWGTSENMVVDICDEGDIFGLRPLLANDTYRLEARTQEESILYAIPIASFEPFTKTHSKINSFLMESFASNTRNPYARHDKGRLVGHTDKLNPNTDGARLLDVQTVNYAPDVMTASSEESIQEVATRMTENRIGAMVIEQDGLPKGIITDKDLRNKIATGRFKITEPVHQIMSTPVITYQAPLTVTQAQMAMMKSNISHLVLTKDGTVNTEAIGVVSKHDVMLSLGNNPAVMVKAIKRASTAEEIKTLRKGVMNLLQGYLDQNIPMALVSKIISELNDVCIKQIVKLCIAKMETQPPVTFAWLAMGSQGRGEQLLHTDQDNALVFSNVPEEQFETTRHYFLKLAEKITQGLHTIGYEFCPADMMGSNPKWCNSLAGFQQMTSKWITTPGPDEVLLSSIFFDYTIAFGDIALANELSDTIVKMVAKHPIFLSHLASSALMSPSPTGFFRQFLVEQDGEHKDSFDLKKRALMPLTDAARVLILSHSITGISNTWDRFEKLAELEPKNKALFLSCGYATKALLKFRTKQGLTHDDSGRYISLETLNKEEKMKLKRTFKTIKEIQELLNVRFMVSRLR